MGMCDLYSREDFGWERTAGRWCGVEDRRDVVSLGDLEGLCCDLEGDLELGQKHLASRHVLLDAPFDQSISRSVDQSMQ